MSEDHLTLLVVVVVVLLFLALAALICSDPARCTTCAEQVRRRDLTDHLLNHCPLNRKNQT